ncbi:MAG TPA: alpha/beta hydrolase [Patescibacteria group bacterium]|nr:alpha/beta hydrolase [Patescibacteria group bacterium]
MGTIGKNIKVYILHGWSYSTEKWKPFLDLLDKNKTDYEMLKIPGLTAPLDTVWEINDYVEWLTSETKSEKKIILLAHSNGARIASAFASKYPAKVEKIIFIGAAGILRKDLATTFRKNFFKILAKSGKKFTQAPILRKLVYRLAGEHDYEKANPIVKMTMLNLISIDCGQFYEKIQSPTLIIWGKQDKLTPLSGGIKINKLISGSKLFVIDNAKHSPQFTNTKEVFEIVNGFLSSRT